MENDALPITEQENPRTAEIARLPAEGIVRLMNAEDARGLGAFTACVTCAPGSPITREVEVAIVPVVGPEVIAGSTRLKAGTAQKFVLNMLSTATMIRLGYVTSNRMTNVKTRNVKLRARAIRILQT